MRRMGTAGWRQWRAEISAYEEKPPSYFCTPRQELIALIPGSGLRVLDIGCGSGATGAVLLGTGKAAWVSGCELLSRQAEKAAAVLSEVVVGDIAEMTIPWPPSSFDCIIAGDVLEHLADPWQVLARIRPLMRLDGVLMASLPNVRNWHVLFQLLVKDEWRYQVVGVMDKTHLRFFTRRSAERMLADCGYDLLSVHPFFSSPCSQRFNSLTGGLMCGFLAERWLFKARGDGSRAGSL